MPPASAFAPAVVETLAGKKAMADKTAGGTPAATAQSEFMISFTFAS
jgi:hypothetical protein